MISIISNFSLVIIWFSVVSIFIFIGQLPRSKSEDGEMEIQFYGKSDALIGTVIVLLSLVIIIVSIVGSLVQLKIIGVN